MLVTLKNFFKLIFFDPTNSRYPKKIAATIPNTAPIIELFSDLYSLYPFHEEKYGHCLAEISGGMEHQTMTTLHEFGLLLVAHELGHSWFGNNVTCATWSDIWINEGFCDAAG